MSSLLYSAVFLALACLAYTLPVSNKTPTKTLDCGWFGFQGYNKSTCYGATAHYEGWQDSEYYCATVISQDLAKGQHLASIHDAFANNWIVGALRTLDVVDDEFWFGLTSTINGNWTWVDKTSVGYTNWATGEPKKGQCAVLKLSDGKWYSRECDTLVNALCEYVPKY